jgi:putative NADH-flavin reductase
MILPQGGASRLGGLPGLYNMTTRLFVLGATGHTGAQVLDLALERGHRVTAFVRSPAKLERRHPLLTVVQGDVRQVDALGQAMAAHDAVVSTLGPARREYFRPSRFMTECAAGTVAAMKTAGVQRLAILSAAVLFAGKGLGVAFFRWLLRHHARDLTAMEAVVRATPFEWTIARPPRLVASDDARYRGQADALPAGGSVASYRAVAAFMLDSVEQRTSVRQVVGVVRANGGA